MSTLMQQFLGQYDPAIRASEIDKAPPSSITATYSLYGGLISLMYDAVEHSYFVKRRDSDEVKKVVGVTSVTGTLNKPVLVPWAVWMTTEELIAEMMKHTHLLPDGEFRVLNNMPWDVFLDIVKESKREYKRASEEAMDIGHIAHDYLERVQKVAMAKHMAIREVWEFKDSLDLSLPVVLAQLDGVDDNLKTLRAQAAEIQTAAVQNCCREAVDWMIIHNFRPLKVENKVYSIRYNVAGTFDSIALVDSCDDVKCCGVLREGGVRLPLSFKDLKVLADWKSSKDMYNEYRLQLAMYYEAYREENGEQLGGRIVVKMPKVVGDKFKAFFLPNEDQEKDLKAFVGLLDTFYRVDEIERIDGEEATKRKAEAYAAKQIRKEEEEKEQKMLRDLRDAERAKKKADAIAAEEAEKQEKARKRLEACPSSGRYKAKNPPKCNNGLGCASCKKKWEEAQNGTN